VRAHRLCARAAPLSPGGLGGGENLIATTRNPGLNGFLIERSDVASERIAGPRRREASVIPVRRGRSDRPAPGSRRAYATRHRSSSRTTSNTSPSQTGTESIGTLCGRTTARSGHAHVGETEPRHRHPPPSVKRASDHSLRTRGHCWSEATRRVLRGVEASDRRFVRHAIGRLVRFAHTTKTVMIRHSVRFASNATVPAETGATSRREPAVSVRPGMGVLSAQFTRPSPRPLAFSPA
jgi:hypothetical protein